MQPRATVVDGLLQDLRYALRTLRRQPGFPAVSILTLGLGIGVTVSLFAVADSVLLRLLIWPEGQQLIRIEERRGGERAGIPWAMTNATYHAWREEASTIEELGAWISTARTWVQTNDAERVSVAGATPSVFRILRASAVAGRLFNESDAEPGAPPTVILSHALWQQRFGGDAAVIGRILQLDDTIHEVVGVMPESFAFPDRETRLWTPLRPLSLLSRDRSQMRIILVETIARLRDGITARQAAAEATARARSVPDIRQAALTFFGSSGDVTVATSPLSMILSAEVRPAVLILLVAVALLFVAAVANVLSMQLARETARRAEMAVRHALGGGTWRLIQLWLVESLIVGIAAGLVGIAVAAAVCSLLPTFLPVDFPRLEEIRLDWRSVAVSVVLTLGVSVICGSVPPLLVQRSHLSRMLSAESIAATGLSLRTRTARVHFALMTAQVAVACLLVIISALLSKSFVAMAGAERGYDSANVLTARVTFPHAHGARSESRAQVLEQMQERLRAALGVRTVAFGNGLPLVHQGDRFGRVIPSFRDPGQQLHIAATWRVVSPNYLEALRMRIIQGRPLLAGDDESSPGAIVVNQAFAREYLGAEPVGQRLQLKLAGRDTWEVVGVVDDVRQGDISEAARPEFFLSYRQAPDAVPFAPMLLLRGDDEIVHRVDLLKAVVRDIDPSLALDTIMTMDDRIALSLARPRVYAVVLAVLALLSLTVTGVGLFGVLSYATARRRSEIGVRAALGASAWDVFGLVLRQAMGIVVAGVALGVFVALVGVKVLASVLYGVAPYDVGSFALGVIAIVVVALLAILLPARNAMTLNPVVALRSR